jgi:uncharacterized protein (TIGR02145 family)
MKKMQLQKLTLAVIALFLMVSCSKDDTPSPLAKTEVTIGTQVWATKNLDVATYRDGTPIPQVTDATEWQNLTTGAWCYYEHSTTNGKTYGKLYNWYAVAGIHDNDPNTPNKALAPTGWHVPSIAEWDTLINFLGGASIAAGVKMKTTTDWTSYPGITNTNSSGFSGLPGGVCNWDQTFYEIKDAGYWWSSTENNTLPSQTHAYFFKLYTNMFTSYYGKINGMSVRCLKD